MFRSSLSARSLRIKKGGKFVKLLLIITILTLLHRRRMKGQPYMGGNVSHAIPLSAFYDSICCPFVLKDSSSMERRCSIRGRYRRTSVRSVISRHAISMLPEDEFDFAEFGVENAESASDFAGSLDDRTTIWLYDTFTGLPEASINDSQAALGRKNKFRGSELHAVSTWQKFGTWNIVVRKGLFSEQLHSRSTPSRLGVLHCDGDLYASINDVLVALYPNVLESGAIIIDDWFGGHTGTWETARKAVYDFIIESEIAPKISTPLGMSAFWFKSKIERCEGCYASMKSTRWSPPADTQELRRFKKFYERILMKVDSVVASDCSNKSIQMSEVLLRNKILQTLIRNSASQVRLCSGKDSPNDASIVPDIIYFGKECIEYRSLLQKWWVKLPTFKIIVLECWGTTSSSPNLGCRPDFYRFVHINGIMPLLTTLYDDQTAFWIKGPTPIG